MSELDLLEFTRQLFNAFNADAEKEGLTKKVHSILWHIWEKAYIKGHQDGSSDMRDKMLQLMLDM